MEKSPLKKASKIQNDLEATACNLGKEDNRLLDGKVSIFYTNFTKVTTTRPKFLCKLNLKKQNGIK